MENGKWKMANGRSNSPTNRDSSPALIFPLSIFHFPFSISHLPMPRFAVILPAAGSSTRFRSPRGKLVQDLLGVPVIARAVLPFVQRPDTHYIFLAVPNSGAAPMQPSVGGEKLDPSTPDVAPAPSHDGLNLTSRSGEIWDAL